MGVIVVREDKMIDTLFPEQADQPESQPAIEPEATAKGDATEQPANQPEAKPEEQPKVDDSMAKLLKRLEDKDRYIGKQGDEIGKLRKKLEKLAEALGIEGDPEEALKEKQEREAEEREKAAEQTRESVRAWVSEKFPEFEKHRQEMEEILKEDAKYGVTEDAVKLFASDPYRFSPDALVGLAERAALRAEIKKLKAQLDTLPKKLSQAVGTSLPKATPTAEKGDTDDVDIYGSLGIYRIGKR